jgi:hypothetical protein
MRLLITKCDWGMEYLGDLPKRLKAFADAGFDGVECFFIDMKPDAFVDLSQELGLELNAGMVAPTVEAFRAELKRVLPYKPTLINCHGGRDYYEFDEGCRFFRECIDIARSETDIEVVHETHRRCTLYSPWGTRRYLEAIPDLYICADFSHFTVVSEGDMASSTAGTPDDKGMMAIVPDREKDAMMDIAIERTHHIHARVGDLHRPQCLDPRIGIGLEWTERYEGWWDRIIEKREVEGRPFMTVCPEYGPPPYAPADPVTNEPFSHPWDLSVWGMERFRARWQHQLNAS